MEAASLAVRRSLRFHRRSQHDDPLWQSEERRLKRRRISPRRLYSNPSVPRGRCRNDLLEQTDVVHDLLAHLAEGMIAMHQEKQQRIEGFWLDLEGVTDRDTFPALKDHGKWEASLWKAQPCRPFVSQESRSTCHLDESLAWNEECFKTFVKMLAGSVPNLSDVVTVYRQHHPEYRARVRLIEATDRLIDLIVYRLYGLTDDEVAVVEGRTTPAQSE